MASRRKKFRPTIKTRSSAQVFNEFIKDLLRGAIQATRLVVTGGTANRPELSYDDPNG
jgi:hypothetical protein